MEAATTENTEQRERQEFIHGLRELAEMLEADERLPLPYGEQVLITFPDPEDGEDKSDTLARLARAIPGRVDKKFEGGTVSLDRRFGPITYRLFSSGVCERVQVGTKTVTREEPVETRTVTEEVPRYEYRCPGSLLAD